MEKSEPVLFFTDSLSTEFQQLLIERKFEDFRKRILVGQSTTRTRKIALDSVGLAMIRNPSFEFNEVRILIKMINTVLDRDLTDRDHVYKLLVPGLEKILKSWIPDRMDDVSSFIQDILADQNLCSIGKILNITIIKDLCNQIFNVCQKAFQSGKSVDQKLFETVKKISYSIETLSEDFVSSPSSMEFIVMSKLYLSALEFHIKYFSRLEDCNEQVVWAFGRRTSWMKWLCLARKRELGLSKVRSSHNLLNLTIEAHTVEMLVKNDWNLFSFCISKRSFRDAAYTLARIWLESNLDMEKACKAFINLKLLTVNDLNKLNQGTTLYELATRQLQMLALYSSQEFEEKKENISEDDWIELAQFEVELYRGVNEVLFQPEVEFLNKILKTESGNDDSFKTDSSCGSI